MNWIALVLLASVALPTALAATPPVPPALAELAAKAGVNAPIAAWCGGEFRPGQRGAFAVAVGSARKGGRYLVIESDGKAYQLSAYSGGADIACYTPAEAKKLNETIGETDTVHGKVNPRWSTAVVCGFVEDTEAVCWQYSPAEAQFVKVGGWTT